MEIQKIKADARAVGEAADSFERAQTRMGALRGAGELTTRALSSAFSDWVHGSSMGIDALQKRLFKFFQDLAIQVTQALILKPLVDSLVGGIHGFLPQIQIPMLADGGTARAGMPHIVGERGPELFVPDRTGSVISYEELSRTLGTSRGASAGGGGGSPANVQVNITAPPGTTAKETGRREAGGGMVMDILIEQIDSALSQRLTDDNSALGSAMQNRFGLSGAAGAR